ncbi:YkgJ family cysteine cluster protein [Shewanella sp. YIC-542]|uniref:YkgJ family cysteine cluster protein n=1 Tax=Shewanella mytili TaxID=3377111 RepID=UPI00398EFB00
MPGMPAGKPAGVRCVQLDEHNLCRLFGKPERPQVCCEFQPSADVCGDSKDQALWLIGNLEQQTSFIR